jgi:hypothetical protein
MMLPLVLLLLNCLPSAAQTQQKAATVQQKGDVTGKQPLKPSSMPTGPYPEETLRKGRQMTKEQMQEALLESPIRDPRCRVECRAERIVGVSSMKAAAIGIRAHSGWAAAVAMAGSLSTLQILQRERMVVIDGDGPRANQPYHFAKDLPLEQAEVHLTQCAKVSRRLALAGLENMVEELRKAGYAIVGCGILVASGRPLPRLAQILASHPMIHTAEGEFFRQAFADACAHLNVPVARFRERELLDRAAAQWRITAPKVRARLKNLGRELGPPWTQDQKNAALAACLLLESGSKSRR